MLNKCTCVVPNTCSLPTIKHGKSKNEGRQTKKFEHGKKSQSLAKLHLNVGLAVPILLGVLRVNTEVQQR